MMAMETALAKASLDVTTMRDPEKIYHLKPIATFTATCRGGTSRSLKMRCIRRM